MPADINGNPSDGKSKVRPPKPPVRKFPLRAHALGYWVKKIKGDYKRFGRWGRIVNGQMTLVAPDGDWQSALAEYNRWIESGSSPQETDALTVKLLCDTFWTAKKRKVEAGEMSQQSLDEYDATCELIVAAFGRERLVDSLRPRTSPGSGRRWPSAGASSGWATRSAASGRSSSTRTTTA